MEIEYWFEMPNKWTFMMPKLREFVLKYIPINCVILVPFAGMYRFEQFKRSFIYNDLNPDIEAHFHMEAYKLKDFYRKEWFDCIVADPPYSHFQGKKSYSGYNVQRITDWRATANYLLKPSGVYIELGFNSTGLRAEIADKIALGVCCMGGSHNDILTIVQKKKGHSDYEYIRKQEDKSGGYLMT